MQKFGTPELWWMEGLSEAHGDRHLFVPQRRPSRRRSASTQLSTHQGKKLTRAEPEESSPGAVPVCVVLVLVDPDKADFGHFLTGRR